MMAKEFKFIKKVKCPCCGYYTIEDYGEEVLVEICPVCFWQYDWVDQKHPDRPSGGPNHGVSLNEAKINYKTFGAMSKDVKEYVRKPLPDELPKNNRCTKKVFMPLFLLIIIAIFCCFLLYTCSASHLPEGYVLLYNLFESTGYRLDYIFWEDRISLLNEQGICIYQTSVKNKDFIIKYQGQYYVNSDVLIKVIQNAGE